MFKAILIDKDDSGYHARQTDLDDDRLPAGDVTVKVGWSTLNYKDGLAITGKSPVVRSFPMVPGIDLAGVVESSEHADWKPGDRVVLNGWGVGEVHWGGLAGKARLKGDWLVPLASPFTSVSPVICAGPDRSGAASSAECSSIRPAFTISSLSTIAVVCSASISTSS